VEPSRFLYHARVPEPETPPPEPETPAAPLPGARAVSPGLLAALAVVVLWAFFLVTGLQGLEFGTHWDENRLMLSFSRAIGTGSLRPTFHVYPAVTHWLMWLPGVPALLAGFPAARACLGTVDAMEPAAWQPCFTQWTAHALESLPPRVVLLRARFLFLLVSSLAVILTGLGVWRHRRRAGEAIVAAAIVGLSWEVSYHARWTAPDALLMTAAALTLWLLHEAEQRGSDRWLAAATVAAALGASMKLTGGILLLPVLLAGATRARPGRNFPALAAGPAARLLATFVIAFCLISPGVLVDAPQVVMEVLHEARHYATGHGVYTVRPGLSHLYRNVYYLLGPLLSPRGPLGFALGAVAVLGAHAAWRDGSRALRAFLIAAGVYLVYLSAQRVMIVRNLIWLTPLLGVSVARGVTFLAGQLTARDGLARRLTALPAALVATVLLLDAASVAHAAGRVADRQRDGQPARALAVLAAEPRTRFFLTHEGRARFAAAGIPVPSNVTGRMEDAEYVLGLFFELPPVSVPANQPGTFALGLTAPELDLDYYPTSLEGERFVALRAGTWAAAMASAPPRPIDGVR
jgi:hypothetical protein